jgi:thiamine-phosphate pyrophosphorylase
MVQVRAHELTVQDLARLATDARTTVDGRALTIVNGSLEAAIESNADGVHLREQFIDAQDVADRAHSRGLIVGRSVHSTESAGRAVDEGADYLFMGTVFASRSHPGGTVCGPEGVLGAVEVAQDVPVIGIGGITPENAPNVMRSGARGVAVIGAIIAVPDATEAARRLSTAIASA